MAKLTPAELKAQYPGPELAQALGLAQERDQQGRPFWPTPADEAIQPHIDAAHAEVDAYLGARYELPLPTLPASLKPVLCDIARYRMAGGERTTEQIALRYEQAVRFLKMVAQGTVSLGIEAKAGEKPVTLVLASNARDTRSLKRSQWTDF